MEKDNEKKKKRNNKGTQKEFNPSLTYEYDNNYSILSNVLNKEDSSKVRKVARHLEGYDEVNRELIDSYKKSKDKIIEKDEDSNINGEKPQSSEQQVRKINVPHLDGFKDSGEWQFKKRSADKFEDNIEIDLPDIQREDNLIRDDEIDSYNSERADEDSGEGDTSKNQADSESGRGKNEGASEKHLNVDKIPISYMIFKKLLKRYKFKCLNEQIYVYKKKKGRYKCLNDNMLKVLIRKDWDDKIQQRLNRNTILEIIERLKTEPTIQVDEDYFNRHMHLMNFLNGVLNLLTGEFMEHSHKFKFTHCIQANYKVSPEGGYTFRKFLNTSMQGNVDKIRQLQEIVGYILSEFYKAKKAPMIIGQPHSGKSTLNRIISTLIGAEHVANVPLNRLHERFILAHLSTKKVNICSEISDEALSSIEVFKAITGNDELVAEYKGKDHFTYKSKIKLLFSGNCMPVLKNQDITTAFFDRLTFLNFNYTVPEKERDHDLERKLLEEDREYIVHWAVEGIRRLMNNNFIFSESEESKEFKAKYILEQNHIKDFIDNNCKIGSEHKIHVRRLYNSYLKYCDNNCFTALSKEKFFAEISKKSVTKEKFRINGSKPLWGFKGITIKTNSELKCD